MHACNGQSFPRGGPCRGSTNCETPPRGGGGRGGFEKSDEHEDIPSRRGVVQNPRCGAMQRVGSMFLEPFLGVDDGDGWIAVGDEGLPGGGVTLSYHTTPEPSIFHPFKRIDNLIFVRV